MWCRLLTGRDVPPPIRLGEGLLPAPVSGRVWGLAVQGIGHQDATPAVGQVLLVNALDRVVVGTPCVMAPYAR